MGDKEAASGAVAVRLRSGEDQGAMPVEQFLTLAKKAIESGD
jgi:threonyl-tRNA synthetase